MDWQMREDEKQKLLSQGIIPRTFDAEKGIGGSNHSIPSGGSWRNAIGNTDPISEYGGVGAGQIIGAIDEIKPAAEVVAEIMGDLVATLAGLGQFQPVAASSARL